MRHNILNLRDNLLEYKKKYYYIVTRFWSVKIKNT